jgi:predicted RNA-binding protein with PIN domain
LERLNKYKKIQKREILNEFTGKSKNKPAVQKICSDEVEYTDSTQKADIFIKFFVASANKYQIQKSLLQQT